MLHTVYSDNVIAALRCHSFSGRRLKTYQSLDTFLKGHWWLQSRSHIGWVSCFREQAQKPVHACLLIMCCTFKDFFFLDFYLDQCVIEGSTHRVCIFTIINALHFLDDLLSALVLDLDGGFAYRAREVVDK